MNKNHSRIVFTIIFILSTVISQTSISFAQPNHRYKEQSESAKAILNGFDYLATQMNNDGGIRWTEDVSSVPATMKVVLALAANYFPQNHLESNSGNSPIDFLKANSKIWLTQEDSGNTIINIARAGQLLTAIAAANENPHAFGDEPMDIVKEVKSQFNSSTGTYGLSEKENVTDQVWAILGLASVNQPVPIDAVDWLAEAQLEDGSWNDGYNGFLDITPLAVMALVASGHREVKSPEIQSGVGFIQENQASNGGWQSIWDTTINADTTGMIIQMITSIGEDPVNDHWSKEGGNPIEAIQSLQQDNGAVGADFANAYSTADALLGLSEQPLFFLGHVVRANRTFTFIREAQLPDGGWGTVGQTVDVMLALRAAGWHPNSMINNKNKPLDYIGDNFTSYISSGPDSIGKLILGIIAGGENPNDFMGSNFPNLLMETYDEEKKAFGNPENTWHQALAILGLYASGEEIPQGAVDTLKSLQADDGGWEFTAGMGTWPDNTSIAIQALLASGLLLDDTSIEKGFDYIKEMQADNGGWGDSSTTAYVIMALNASGQPGAQWETEFGRTPLLDMLSFQKSNGAFVYTWEYPNDNLMSTNAAMFALFGGNYLFDSSRPLMTSYAGLIVDPKELGERIEKCLPLVDQSQSGLAFLESADLEIEAEQGFINTIAGYANPDGGTFYWSYWHWNGREWQFYETGASETVVLPGSIQAWYLTSWEEFPSQPPEYAHDLREICGNDILKYYQAQPYLNYHDLKAKLNFIPLNELPAVEDETTIPTEEPVETIISKPEETKPAEASQISPEQPEHQITPIIILGVIGLATIIVIFMVIKQRNQ